MIVIFELNCPGSQHVVVNAAMVETIRYAYPDQPIHVVSEKGHAEEIARSIPSSLQRMTFINVEVVDPLGPRLSVFRSQVGLIATQMRRAPANEGLLCVFLSATEATIFAANMAKLTTRRRDARFQFILHGQLAELRGWRSRNPLRRATDLRSALWLMSRTGAHAVVLEDAIRDELVRIAPWIAKSVGSLPHPLLESEADISDGEEPAFVPPIRIGFLGLATPAKGFPEFLRLAAKAKARFGASIEFAAYGRLHPELEGVDQSPLTEKIGLERLPRETFTLGLRRLHYVCVPYHGAHYALSASGVLVDAISFAKPIITLRQPITTSLFEEHGDVGYLCEGTDDMLAQVCGLMERKDAARFGRQRDNMRRACYARMPKNLNHRYGKLIGQMAPGLDEQLTTS